MLKKLSLYIIVLLLVASCRNEVIKDTMYLVEPPVATKQLGPSIFFHESFLIKNNIEEGTPIRVEINNFQIDLRPYLFFGKENEFALHSDFVQKFNINEKTNTLTIQKINENNTELTKKPIKFSVENYHGNNSKWDGFAFGAPHGDCDNETGKILNILTDKYGVSSTAAYGCRLSYRGIWFDCNRPLMQEAKPNGQGILNERKWNSEAEEKYEIYQDSVFSNSNLRKGERFKLFCSFHGHDLSVKLPSGKSIQRPVIEGLGMNFSDDELRKIKAFYNSVKHNYYQNPPELYFGNLPEDSTYYIEGVRLEFVYTGLGARTYGCLRRDFLENGLHFETPDIMRIPLESQEKTADLLFSIYQFVNDSVFTKRESAIPQTFTGNSVVVDEKIKISSGTFLMGNQDKIAWSSEEPQHSVHLDEFYIDKYEVSNSKFAKFLNDKLQKEEIYLSDEKVFETHSNNLFLDLSKPFSEILFNGKHFEVTRNRENHPVVFITLWAAESFAKSVGGRLPTEAEWEKAASWNQTENRKSYYSISKDTISKSDANYEVSGDTFERHLSATTPIGYYKTASFYGVKDMSGNVWEWTSDNFIGTIYSERKGKITTNPKVEKESTMKVIKGGAWDTEYSVLRSTMRLGIHPNATLINVGFRCVKVLDND